MPQPYFEHELPNGMHLLVEQIAGVQSAAFTLLVPAGSAHDPPDHLGTGNLLSMMVTKGAGDRDSIALTSALDRLGAYRNESTEIMHTSFTAALLARNLIPVLELTADILRRPHLAEDQFQSCQLAALQEIKAIEDEPSQHVFIELKRLALPDPMGRPVLGLTPHVERLQANQLRASHRASYRPNGSVLGVAGAVDFQVVKETVERLFSDWPKAAAPVLQLVPNAGGRHHVPSEKVQTQIGVAFDSVAYGDLDFYNAHGAVGVLSGGMSARLFTEIREKRGLCYAVGASFLPLKDRGVVFAHASSNNERAGETLRVLLEQLRLLRNGISQDEVDRVKAGLKSALIMQEESTSARASVLARSWYNLGRVRTLAEVARGIDELTPASILGYLDRHPPENFRIVTLGPSPLENAS